MTTGFYIAFRFHGYAMNYAKWVKTRVHYETNRLGIKRVKRVREVPHITLFGPAKTNNMRQVISEVKRIGHKYALVPFTIDGFSRFDNRTSKVVYLDVDPSPKLEDFRWELAHNLLKISKTASMWDDKERYKFHSTVKKFTNISDNKFDKLCDFLERLCRLTDYEQFRRQHKISTLDKLLNFIKKHFARIEEEDRDISQHLLRITILGKGSRIQYEYDLVLGRLLNRRQALSRHWWQKTIIKFRELQHQSQ